jgi:hypothetical protein
MPRKTNPALITVGRGLAGPDSIEANAIIPAASGHEPAYSDGGGGGLYALELHIKDEHNAHPAHAVSIDSVPDIYDAAHVEGVLDELSALVPPRPPTVGALLSYTALDCRPDWGILKLDDSSYFHRDAALPEGWGLGITEKGSELYPYYHTAPDPTQDFATPGEDPSDPVFNVFNADYRGGGRGEAHAGAFTRSDFANAAHDLVATHMIIPSKQVGESPSLGRPVVVSGVVYPADRGTMALLRGAPSTGFTGVAALDRVVCAINLGEGILDHCDGDPGGIFWLGTPGGEFAPHSYDPFSYPGRATGQYNLEEIHTGVSVIVADGNLPSPFFDMDADGAQGWPHGGQVRLGSDANAGVPVIAEGIPILGGTTAARAGGHDQNFFGYRLPVLENYKDLKWAPISTRERYFGKPTISQSPSADLDSAGNYPPGGKDWWTHQIGRYRHQFHLPNDVLPEGDPRDCGSYVLVHFKKEQYFEEAVRDGVWPSDDRVYSMNLMDWTDPESVANIVSVDLTGGILPRHSYHVIRSGVFEDPKCGGVFSCSPIANIIVTVDGTFVLTWPTPGDLLPGGTYRFDLSSDSVDAHPFHLSTTGDGVHNSGSIYGTGVKYFADGVEVDQTVWLAGFSGFSERVLELTVDAAAYFETGGTLHYFCHTHPNMGDALAVSSGLATWSVQAHSMSGTCDFQNDPAGLHACSGVTYFRPLGLGGAMSWQIEDLDISWRGANTVDPGYAGVFEHSYRTHESFWASPEIGPSHLAMAALGLDGVATPDSLMGNMDPVFLSFSAFTPGSGIIPDTALFTAVIGMGLSTLGDARRERLGFSAADLIRNEANAPVPIPDNLARITWDSATASTHAMHLTGDQLPKFSGDAIVRAFVRKPLWHQSPLIPYIDYFESWEVTLSSGGFLGSLLWFGSGSGGAFEEAYGNNQNASTQSDVKDSEERFLDESYRSAPLDLWGLDAETTDTLKGPGLPYGVLDCSSYVKVREPFGDAAHWYAQSNNSAMFLDGVGGDATPQAQVAGWPDRNPSILEGVYSPSLCTGVLVYPQEDYNTGYLPASGQLVWNQPDYSTLSGDREYIRLFHIPAGEGQPFVRIQLVGLTLEDFVWDPGNSRGIQLYVKVPGQTTWMNIGRPDGDGPSKQDAFSDGAGCVVVGPDTRNGMIPSMKIVRSQVQVNLGPAANLFLSAEGKTPLLFKAVLQDNVAGRALNLEQGGPTGSPANLRGLAAMRMLGGRGPGDGSVGILEGHDLWGGPWDGILPTDEG